MKERVLLGMSSGIDSSVSAILLKNSGFEVVGITFIFSELDFKQKNIIESTKYLANSLNIKHHVVDLRKEFNEHVISYFKSEYLVGRTPFPCAVCNPQVKFKKLIRFADKLNCQFISTGHYAQIVVNERLSFISKGVDREKDQSFFLWGLASSVIDRMIFPLGNFLKSDVREMANENGFPSLTNKKESLGICFMENNDYRKYLKEEGINVGQGNFVNRKGQIIGKHDGFINFTIGQRRGLGLNLNTPMFVFEIKAERNEVILGDFNELQRTKIELRNYHFPYLQKVSSKKKYIVKIRYRLQETPCIIDFQPSGKIVLNLSEPVSMVANGQTAVLYDKNRVIGGGFIESSE